MLTPRPADILFAGMVIGFIFGGGFVQIHHDRMWGLFNHRFGRKWGWRPHWKHSFSRK